MKTIIKISCILVIALLQGNSIFSQTKKSAYGGENGVYIMNTLHFANKSFPYNNGILYKVERSIENENRFTTIAEYSSPYDFEEFVKNAEKFKYPYETTIDKNEMLLIWKKFMKTKNVDSIKKSLAFNYIAAGFGVTILDSTAKKNINYSYKISLFDAAGNTIESTTTNAVSFPEKMTYLQPKFLKQTTDGISVTSIWFTLEKRNPHHFKVFRSNGDNAPFREYAISKSIYQSKDTTFFAFTDKDLNKGTMYRYFISPSNNYGNYNVLSDTILGTNLLGKDAYLPTSFDAKAIDSLNAIALFWKLESPFELNAVEVYRGLDFDGEYQKIISLSPEDTLYLDKSIASGQRYFYSLKTVDRLGRTSIFTNKAFAICNGKEVPLPPIRTIAKATEKGVDVFWLPNGENIRGYYIYRCDGIEGEFSQISDFIEYTNDSLQHFIDKDELLVNGLTYSYCVKQENNGHLLSEASNFSLVQPFHGKATQKAQMVTLSATSIDKGFLLTWDLKIPESNMAGISVYRKSEGENEFKKLNKSPLDLITRSFTDSSITKNKTYYYYISIDDTKGKMVTKTNEASITQQDYSLSAPFNLLGSVENGKINFKWENASNNLEGFKIYKRTPGQIPVEIAKVDKQTLSYSLAKPNGEELVIYYVVTYNKLGESKPSNEWKEVEE